MYKTFTTRFGTDAPAKILELRKEFPHCSFAAGVRKDKRGIFAFASNDIKEYGESWELANGDTFFAPTEIRLEEMRNDISKYQTEYPDRIKVDLMNGKKLMIYPASALPRKVYFTRTNKTPDTPYDVTIPYGKLAYHLYDRTQKEEKIMLDDSQMVEFVKVALKHSYALPEALWDALQLVSYGDFDKIFAAGMGMDWDYLQEEVKKSNAASPQMTGTTAA
jgi:hypothetical protein